MSGYELKIMKLELNTFSYIIVFNETLRVTHDTCRDMKRKLHYANMYKQKIITAIALRTDPKNRTSHGRPPRETQTNIDCCVEDW